MSVIKQAIDIVTKSIGPFDMNNLSPEMLHGVRADAKGPEAVEHLIDVVNKRNAEDTTYEHQLSIVGTEDLTGVNKRVIDVATSGKSVLYFTPGKPATALTRKLLSLASDVNERDIQPGKRISRRELRKIDNAIEWLREAPIYIQGESVCALIDVLATGRRYKYRNPPLGLIVIDSLEQMRSAYDNRYVAYVDLLGGLSGQAKGLRADIIAISHRKQGSAS